jgi:hypothetical protein
MQCKHTCHALGFRNQNLRYCEIAPLGESTPPQGMNGLILSNSYLLNPWKRFAGIIHAVHSPQHTLHQVQQPLIGMVAIKLLRLYLVMSWCVLPWFTPWVSRNKPLLLLLMPWNPTCHRRCLM